MNAIVLSSATSVGCSCQAAPSFPRTFRVVENNRRALPSLNAPSNTLKRLKCQTKHKYVERIPASSSLASLLIGSANPTEKKQIKKAKESKYTIDCSKATAEDVYDMAAFEKFLHDRIKVNDRTGNLGDSIKIEKSGDSVIITVQPGTRFPKRYLKCKVACF
jgi:hypothetical protein